MMMRNPVLTTVLVIVSVAAFGQRTLRGTVIDSKTKLPLSRATIKVNHQNLETSSNANGEFVCQTLNEADSIEISHVGYRTFKKRVSDLSNPTIILLEDYSLQLRTITITSRKLNLKDVDNSLRRIKGNLYTYEIETTNGMYNLFLNFLEEQDDQELLKLCDYDLTAYSEEDRKFF